MIRRGIVLMAVALFAGAAPAAAEQPYFGTAVDMAALQDEPEYARHVAQDFNSVTAENVMKWETVEPQRGVDDFSQADALVRFARRHHQSVYGHNLVWHNQLPQWLTGGSFTPRELKAILRRHIFAVAGHFRGKVRAWDVVNEAFNDDGSWRGSLWYQAFGPRYVEWALRWAHRADPRVKLYLNDYNIEGLGPKSDAYYALARRLQRRGVPLDGIGIQGHLSIQYPFPQGVPENLQRFARLGLDTNFTEVDVRMPLPPTEAKLATQADYFRQLIDACLNIRSCRTFTLWGFTDKHSWVPGVFAGEGAATPRDEQYRPKPAWTALQAALAPPVRVTVDPHRTYQRVDGFGISEAFQRSNILHGSRGLSPAKQQQVLDLLFTRAGTDFSLLRNGIGSSPTNENDWMRSIAPVAPAGPDEPLQYQWDRDDNSQVWLAHEAIARGVRHVYADAWSAPGYMKTNGSDANGGTLKPEWAPAYARYLAKYIRLYGDEGIPIDLVGFLNEPDIATSYASMQFTPQQAAGFVKLLGPELRRQGLRTKVACCDATGWDVGKPYVDAILDDPQAARWLGVATAHGYSSPPAYPLTTRRPVWQTEWAQLEQPWNPAWDDGSDASGLTWAQNVQDAFVRGGVNAFFYWWGAHGSDSNSGLIRMDGDGYEVSKRFWALAAFSRFVRPGAERIAAGSHDDTLHVSAFRNRDGSVAVQVLNTGQEPARITGMRRARSYVVDAAHDLAPQPRGSTIVPARALVTYVAREG
jgi:GH35 family endo-1,4-beta-xylanase/O-glycosyl hydrolase